jgi:sigma-E factor negative regulatory protein RseA
VIGDLLRSDEHRADAAYDARFLASLRERLAHEPAVLAPASISKAPTRRTTAWMAPAAVAAGFVAVAGVLVVTRIAVPDASADRNALAAGPRGAPQAVAASMPALDGPMLIRSAELDRYLAAHRQFANASTLVAPGSVMRSAATTTPER